MIKTLRATVFIIIALYSQNIFCQNQDSITKINRARTLFNIGVELARKGEFNQAKDSLEFALELRSGPWGRIVPELSNNYFFLGRVTQILGELDQSLEYFKLAEECLMLRTNPDLQRLSLISNSIGNSYFYKLDYNNALKYYEQSIFYLKKDPATTSEEISNKYFNIATFYYNTDNYDKAIEIAIENIYHANKEDKKSYFELLANICFINKQFSEARKYYEKAIALCDIDNINDALIYLNYSNFLINTNQLEDAEEILERVYEMIINQPNNGLKLSTYYLYKGELSLNKSIETKDIEAFNRQKRINILNSIDNYKNGLLALMFPKDYSPDSLLKTKVLDLLLSIDLLKRIGDNFLDLSKLEEVDSNKLPAGLSEAIENYRKVSSLIQQARKEITSDASKIQLTSLQYESFIKMIQAANTAYSITKDVKYVDLAFQNAERTKGSALFDKISDQFALENSLIPDSLLELEAKWNKEINDYSQMLHEETNNPEPDSSRINEYKTAILDATGERDKLNRFIETNYSDFYELKYSNSTLSINDLQKKIKEDQIVLEYILNETDTLPELYLFLISKDEIGFYKSNVTVKFISSIEDMFNFMASSEYYFHRNEDSKKFCVSSHNLYLSLIEPIKNKIQDKNLVIIPDGKLSYIPFEALIESLPDTTRMVEFNKLDYLIRNYCINYSVSANLLFGKNKESNKTRINTVAFAPKYNYDTIQVAGKKLILNPLPGVQKEVSNISGIVKTLVFKEDEATEANFLGSVVNFDILHLAMHAFINDSLPAFSSMAFSQNVTGDSISNGLLNTADIYGLKLKAKLAVLSACNTGTGKLLKGEGIMSLARGFLYAGCPAIVMSLWKVDDFSATQIMTSFYKYMKKGKSKDQALHLAKLEYLESANSRRAHPHYWLSFVHIGDNTPLFISYDFYFFIILLLALSGIGIDQLIRIKKARKKRA